MHRVLTYLVSSTVQGGAQVSPGHLPAPTRGTHTLELTQMGPPSSTDTTHPPPQELGSSVAKEKAVAWGSTPPAPQRLSTDNCGVRRAKASLQKGSPFPGLALYPAPVTKWM